MTTAWGWKVDIPILNGSIKVSLSMLIARSLNGHVFVLYRDQGNPCLITNVRRSTEQERGVIRHDAVKRVYWVRALRLANFMVEKRLVWILNGR